MSWGLAFCDRQEVRAFGFNVGALIFDNYRVSLKGSFKGGLEGIYSRVLWYSGLNWHLGV